MFAISTLTQNSAGAFVFYELPESDLFGFRARVTRQATLDGGVAIVHSGTVHGDRALTVVATVTQAVAEALRDVHLTESLLRFATADGLYKGAIEWLQVADGRITLTCYLKEKEA